MIIPEVLLFRMEIHFILYIVFVNRYFLGISFHFVEEYYWEDYYWQTKRVRQNELLSH